jgi:tetratricopeptide (TPR) repeat protein
MLKKNYIYFVFFCFFIIFTSFLLAEEVPLNIEEKKVDSEILNITTTTVNNYEFKTLFRKNYDEIISLYKANMDTCNYLTAIYYAEIAFAKARNIYDRINVLFFLADANEKNGNYKEAKLIYRQIITNYKKDKIAVQKAKEKLLAI